MNYTKGEWKTSYRQHEDGMYSQEVFDTNGETIATVGWHGVMVSPGHITTDREANAHLISAAPIGDELADAVLNNAGSIKIKEIARRFKAKAEGK